MAEIFDWLLNPVRAVFEYILTLLAKLNIAPSVFATQILALLVFLGALLYARKKLKSLAPNDPARLTWTVGATVCGLIGAAILTDWAVQLLFPLPNTVEGTLIVNATGAERSRFLFDSHVELLDFRGHRVVSGAGTPETSTGRYELAFSPEFSNPPRTLLATAACCDSVRRAISRRDLRAHQAFDVTITRRGGR